MSTDKLILNHKATVVPAREALKADGNHNEEYILVMSESRNPPRAVPRELALLLLTFRKPATVTEAVIAVSRVGGGEPGDILERFYQSLPQLIEQHYLEYADDDAGHETAVPDDQESTPTGFDLLRVMNRLEDTEVLLVRQGETFAVIKRARVESEHVARRLAWEAQVLERLNGAVAPNLLAAKLDDPYPYLVVEAIPGLSLWEIQRSGLFERWEVDIPRLGKNILKAYRTLHEQGIIHSDIHPRNILVEIDGNVRLIDFEYAGLMPQVEHIKAVGITPYFAPEVAAAEIEGRASFNTAWTDQYSVAAVITWLATGQYHIDFVPDARRALEQIVVGNLRTNNLPEPQDSVLKKALAIKPEDRFASVAEFETNWVTSRQTSPSPRPEPATSRQSFKRWANKMKPGGTLWSTIPKPPHASLYFGLAGSVWALVEGSAVLDWDEGLHNTLPWLYRLDTISSGTEAFVAPARGLLPEDSKPYRIYHDACGIYLLKTLASHRLGLSISSDAVMRYARALGTEGPTELTDGLGGYLYGCVLLELMGEGDGIRTSANRAFALIEGRVQEKLNSESLGYLGMAHGLAGECYSLMAWCLVSHRSIPEVVSVALERLEQHTIPVGYGYEMPIADGVRDTNGASWCHGAGGYIYLWRIAARVLHEPSFLERAEIFAKTVWSADWTVHQLCCGSIGGAFAVAGLARELGDSRWDRRARAMLAKALGAMGDTQDQVSLFKGDVGGFLLEAQVEAEVPLIFPLCGEVLA